MPEDRTRTSEAELATAYDVVVRKVLSIYPQARAIRIIADGPDGKAAIPIPMGPPGDDLATLILDALGRLKAGEWLPGKTLAAHCGVEPDTGHFKRTASRLVKDGSLESNRQLGYRLTQTK